MSTLSHFVAFLLLCSFVTPYYEPITEWFMTNDIIEVLNSIQPLSAVMIAAAVGSCVYVGWKVLTAIASVLIICGCVVAGVLVGLIAHIC